MPYEDDIGSHVDRHGWSAVCVYDGSPPFIYSVGLMFTAKHPELIIFGLQHEGYNILRAMVEDIRNGRSFAEPATYAGVLRNENVKRISGNCSPGWISRLDLWSCESSATPVGRSDVGIHNPASVDGHRREDAGRRK